MMKKKSFHKIIILIFFALLTACVNGPTVSPTPEITAPVPHQPKPTSIQNTQVRPDTKHTANCQFTTEENIPEVEPASTHYHLDVSLDYDNHRLSVSQRLNYTNITGERLTELPLVVSAAASQNAFSLLSVQLASEFHKTSITFEGTKVLLQLDPALESGDRLIVDLVYEISPPQQTGAFGYTQRQMLLADWYPTIPPYILGQGWLINPPGAVGEHQVYPQSNFSVNLQLLPSEKELVVAASAPISAQSEGCYQYSAISVRNFSLAISPEYHLTSRTNALTTVKIYTFPEHAEMGKRAVDLALQAWETFTDIYGPNPRDFMSMVEADIDDGLETDGLFYLSDWYFKTADETPQNYFELLVVHETSHQWLYGLVHNDQAHEPWLDESLATYSELLFYESHHPELVQWWWNYRVNEYSPSGYVNATIYDFDNYREYINAVYLMGARFIDTIRQSIGETDFRRFLYDYVQSGNGKILSAEDFFTILTEITPENINPIQTGFFK